MLLEDNGGREKPVLPSLRELVVDRATSDGLSELPIFDTLTKRVEQGVPLDMLDLRTCQYTWDTDDAVQLFRKIVVNVLRPVPSERQRITSTWDAFARGLFTEDRISDEDTDDDGGDNDDEDEDEDDDEDDDENDDEDDSDTGSDEDEDDEE